MTTTYNITHNAKFDSYEVTFESKPATAVLDALKALKMRWNPKKACWYGFAKEHEIISAILENGEGETITGEKTEGATVYADGYLGGGAVYGSKSNLHLYGADLSKAIREDIKRAGIKGVSVRCKRYTGGQSVGVTVSLRPDEFVSLAEYIEKFEPGTCGDYGYIRTDSGVHRVTDREFYEASAEEQQKIRREAAEYEYEQLTAKECSLNIFYLNDCNHFVPETLKKIKTIQAIICAYRYDESNGQVDYFDTNFYYDIYTKPAAVKPTTPDDEPTKPTKDEPKEEPAAEETAPVQPAEQAQEAESVVETAEIHTPSARYQVIMSQCFSADHEEDIITAGVCYDNLPEARCTAIGVIGEYDASAIFDGKTGKIIEITSGFPYWRIYSTGSAPAEEPATICRIDENGHDIIVKRIGDNRYTVEYCEDGKRLGEVEENCTAEYIDFRYGIIVNPEHNIQNQPTPAPTPAETTPEAAGDTPEEVPETVEPTPEPVKPSPIREDLVRRAHDMMSYTNYREGSATAEYNTLCDRAEALAEEQKRKVDPMYHDKIDALVSSYKRRMADNINRRNEIGTRCPSVLVAGPANFPVKKKLKQNAASDRNMEEYNEIQGILDRIRSTGTGGITTDDPNVREKIEKKIEALEALQNTMKAVNAYYRKRGTLDGCPDITPDQASSLAAGMERDWRSDPKPFEPYQLSNNNAEIHRLRARLAELDKLNANTETGWTFDGGTVEICREDNRVRIFHDSKPDADVISELKSNGFKWARSVGAWQRQLTENAINAARRITT